jgi:hypothetical protein
MPNSPDDAKGRTDARNRRLSAHHDLRDLHIGAGPRESLDAPRFPSTPESSESQKEKPEMTKREKEAAFQWMRDLAASGRYRVIRDSEGLPIIPGRLGRIEWHDPLGRELAVFTDRPRLFARLLALAGVKRHQTGDDEIRAVFPIEGLPAVAGLIQAKRRRSQTSPTSLQNLRSRATSAA